MKPKSKKELWLLKNMEELETDTFLTDRKKREAKRIYKRGLSKLARQDAKRKLRERL